MEDCKTRQSNVITLQNVVLVLNVVLQAQSFHNYALVVHHDNIYHLYVVADFLNSHYLLGCQCTDYEGRIYWNNEGQNFTCNSVT